MGSSTCRRKELQEGNFPANQKLDLQFHDNIVRAKAIATKEGVWKGVFRPAELLKSNYRWLKGAPITLNHPPEGVYDPSLAIGQVIDVEWDEDQNSVFADCEMWPEKCPPDLIKRIEAGEPVDVSTGYFSYQEKAPGKWRDQEYSEIEKSLFFDHLAIVPVGACTTGDGCGFGSHVGSEIKLHEDNKTNINDKEEGMNMEDIKLETPEDFMKISDDISKIEDLPEFKERTTGLLSLLGNQIKDKTGIFVQPKIESPSYPKPKLIKAQDSDSLTLDFESSIDIEESKGAITDLYGEAMKTVAEKEALIKKLQDENAKLHEEKNVIEDTVRSEHISTIKAHSGGDLTEEEAKVYEVMPLDQLRVVSSNMAKIKVHSSNEGDKTKFMMPEGGGSKKPSVEQLNAEFDAALGLKR